MAITTGDSVVIEYTGRLDDGTVFDTSRESVAKDAGLADQQPDREYTPLTVEVGAQEVIQGLDEALVGMEPDDTPTVEIPPEKGYGEWSEKRVQEYDVDDLSQMLGGQLPEEGAYLETQEGHRGEVTEVGQQTVRIDFNPQLAGEQLEFEIEIVDVIDS